MSEEYNEVPEVPSGSHMNDESFNGWANRETWAFNLHWSNDQWLYNETLDAARTIAAQTESDRDLGKFVVDYWDDRASEYDQQNAPRPQVLLAMLDEAGSLWRINYAEVGAAVRESLENES